MINSLRGSYLRHRFFFDQRLNRTPPSRARLRLHLGERRGPGAAVLQHQRLHADRRRDHRSAQLDAEHARSAGRAVVDEGDAPRQDRRRVPADRDRHVPGDRAERVLRLRRDVPDQQRRREPAARRAGDVLPRARRLQPRACASGARSAYAQDEWRVGIEADAELRSPLRADQPDHGGRGSADRIHPRRAVDWYAPTRPSVWCFPAMPGVAEGIAKSANGIMPRVGFAWDPTGAGHLVAARELRRLLRPVPERSRNGLAGAGQLDPLGAVQPVQRRRPELPEPVRRTSYPAPEYVRPALHRLRHRRGGEAAVYAELERQRRSDRCSTSTSSKSATSARTASASAAQHRGESGRVRPWRHRAERRPPPHLRELSRRRRHVRLLDDRDAVEHHARELPGRPVQRVAAVLDQARLQRLVLALEDRWTSCRR